MAPIRLGLVGFGLIWDQEHEPIVSQMAGTFQIVALSASSDRSAAKAAARYPGIPFTRDYHELVTRRDVDAVVVQTPIPLNAPVTIAALRAGKDVISEKPIGRTCNEGAQVLQVLRETGRRLYILDNAYYQPRWDVIRSTIAEGAIGQVVQYEQVAHSPVDPVHKTQRNYGTTDWRINPQYPLGYLLDAGVHQIAALSKVFGHPQQVQALAVKLRPEYGDVDQAIMLFEYENNVHGVFSQSGMLTDQRNYFFIRGTQGVLEILRDELVIVDNDGNERRIALLTSSGAEEMWQAIGAAIVSNVDAPYTPDMAAKDVCILDAVDRALALSQKQDIAPSL
ncbi:MAG: Gfo/Idh/MocA family oxidoreductase [Anaerolineae bacterium]